MTLTAADLKVGRVYEAKRPRQVSLGYLLSSGPLLWNDREILWIGQSSVQYDGPIVRIGRRYKWCHVDEFLEWAGRDVTDEMPEDGGWREASTHVRDRNGVHPRSGAVR